MLAAIKLLDPEVLKAQAVMTVETEAKIDSAGEPGGTLSLKDRWFGAIVHARSERAWKRTNESMVKFPFLKASNECSSKPLKERKK